MSNILCIWWCCSRMDSATQCATRLCTRKKMNGKKRMDKHSEQERKRKGKRKREREKEKDREIEKWEIVVMENSIAYDWIYPPPFVREIFIVNAKWRAVVSSIQKRTLFSAHSSSSIRFLFGFVLVTFIASHSRLPQCCFDTYNTKSCRLHSGLDGQNQCICVHLLLDNAFGFFNWSFRAGIKTILLVDLMQNGLQLSYSDKRKTLAIQSHRQTKKNAQI